MARLPHNGVAHASAMLPPSDPPRTQLPEGIFNHRLVRSEFRYRYQSDEEEPKVIVVLGNATPSSSPAPLPMGPVNLIGGGASRPPGSASRKPGGSRVPLETRNPPSIRDAQDTVARGYPASQDEDAAGSHQEDPYLLALRHEGETLDRRIQDLCNDRLHLEKLRREASATVWGPDGVS